MVAILESLIAYKSRPTCTDSEWQWWHLIIEVRFKIIESSVTSSHLSSHNYVALKLSQRSAGTERAGSVEYRQRLYVVEAMTDPWSPTAWYLVQGKRKVLISPNDVLHATFATGWRQNVSESWPWFVRVCLPVNSITRKVVGFKFGEYIQTVGLRKVT